MKASLNTSNMQTKSSPGRAARMTLEKCLDVALPAAAAGRDELRTSVLPALAKAISQISEVLRSSHNVLLAGSSNAFGDDQLNVDVATENVLREALRACPAVATVSSEEEPVESPNVNHVPNAAEQYTIAFDPLDGSSIIAPNWSVGTIVGIWDGVTTIDQNPRRRQIAAVLGVYGPRTTALVAIRVPGARATCFEMALHPGEANEWEITRSDMAFDVPPFKARYFAPANLRSASEHTGYSRLISNYINDRYTLRYSGGLVPDVVHALVKGHGIYLSPVTATSTAKLRRLYELYPIALVIECAGGKAVDPESGTEILDKALMDTDERAGIICGTATEVDRVIDVFRA